MVSNGQVGNGAPHGPPLGPRRDTGGACLYAIGDIHGRPDLVERMHGLIAEDAGRAPPGRLVAIYLGDYIDRGPDSAWVIDFLLDRPLAGFESFYLKGNHEDFLLGFMEDRLDGLTWILNGGDATLESYGIALSDMMDRDEPGDLKMRFAQALPARHGAFLRALKTIHLEGDYCFVHAGIRPGVPLEAQDEHDLVWIREPFLSSSAASAKCVIHGHTITSRPELRANRIGIDTGAYITGHLTCVVLDGGEPRFLQT